MAAQGLDRAEAGGVDGDLKQVEESLAGRSPARDLEGQHSARHSLAQRPCGQGMLGM